MLNIHPQVGSTQEPSATSADRVFWFRGLDHVDFHLHLENRRENGESFTHLHLFAHTEEGAVSEVARLPLTGNCAVLLEELFNNPPESFIKPIMEPFLARVSRRINCGPIVALAPV